MPTWRGDCDFRFPNDAIPGKRRVSQTTSRLGLSSSQGSREWTDGWGNKVRGPWRTSTDFLYHAPLGCLCATLTQIMNSLVTQHRRSKSSPLTAKHPLKPEAERSSWNQQRITEFLKGKRMHEPVLITRSNVSSNTYLIGRCLLLFKNTNCHQ